MKKVITLTITAILCACPSRSLRVSAAESENEGTNAISVFWFAPFASGGGYCSEAFAVAKSMHQISDLQVHVHARHHGDSLNGEFLAGLDDTDKQLVAHMSSPISYEIRRSAVTDNVHIAVCHSEPGAWHAPTPRYYTNDCPPPDAVDYKIGRTMFETDRLPDGWVARMQYMDEVWVPSSHSARIFMDAGVEEEKVIVVGEPVDTDTFHPTDREPIRKFREKHLGGQYIDDFLFLFVGKWETRKGLKLLLRAFCREFDEKLDSKAVLVILTSAYHSSSDFERQVDNFLLTENLIVQSVWDSTVRKPRIVILSRIPQTEIPQLYASVDVLVIPSFGEGWGRPHVESMSSGVPVIATNWSGPTAYMNEVNGLPIRVHSFIPAEGWKGHSWALPDETHLQKLMRYAYSHPTELSVRGSNARATMVSRYSLKNFSYALKNELVRISLKITNRRQLICKSKSNNKKQIAGTKEEKRDL